MRRFKPLRLSQEVSRALRKAPSITQSRFFTSSRPFQQEHSDPKAHRNFYKTHGRALFKALTLAFFTYQVICWAWLTLETEEIKDHKNREIKSLENEVRLLDESRRAHRPGDLDGVRTQDGNKRQVKVKG